MHAQFFKSFVVKGRAVLAVKHENDCGPVIQWFYQPDGLATCSMTHEYEDDSAGSAKCQQAFDQLDHADAELCVKLFDEVSRR